MKNKMILLLAGLFLIRCAAYKQLKPEPALSPQERGYIELQNDKKNFKLSKDKKYFIVFPGSQHENSYLVLDNSDKNLFHSYLTTRFDDGKGPIVPVLNETPEPAHLDVYPLDNTVQKFYWVIDQVKQDMELRMTYRYVEKWRFKFENKYDSYKKMLSENRMDRKPYQNIGTPPPLNEQQIENDLKAITLATQKLQALRGSLQSIEKIFPAHIVNTTDSSYQNYLLLKNDLDDELTFQQGYKTVLTLLKHDLTSRGNTAAFLKGLDDFERFVKIQSQYPDNIVNKIRDILGARLPEAVPFYERRLAGKTDSKKISIRSEQINNLYELSGISAPNNFRKLYNFVRSFNGKAQALQQVKKKFNLLKKEVENSKAMPSNTYFGGVLTRLSKLKFKMPSEGGTAFTPYSRYRCVKALNGRIRNLRFGINKLLNKYREADALIPEINAYKNRKNFRGMLRIIKNNPQLSFLRSMYKGLDPLSLKRQKKNIQTALTEGDYQKAEQALKTLYYDRDFINLNKIKPQKTKMVKTWQDTLFNRIDRLSRKRARQFVNTHLNTLKNVDQLYNNPVFQPLYLPTFSTGSKAALEKRNQKLRDRLNELKELEFPARAIKHLYRQLTADPEAKDGVLKARAVVSHGQHYKGTDRKIKRSAAECDPWAAKWLTKAKTYRRLFALPVTSRPQGKNEYVFRASLQIPSKAKFPVYEVYIRLPKEVAANAKAEKWYDKITLNKKIVKNEGRYTITSPLPSNGYECQISPLRTEKGAANVLEVHFTNPSFKVQQISVMAQKPIIKKH